MTSAEVFVGILALAVAFSMLFAAYVIGIKGNEHIKVL